MIIIALYGATSSSHSHTHWAAMNTGYMAPFPPPVGTGLGTGSTGMMAPPLQTPGTRAAQVLGKIVHSINQSVCEFQDG